MTATVAAGANADQTAYWNEAAGPTWAALQDVMDEQLRELGLRAMAALSPRAGEQLIDIGCGCGDTTLELARRVGPSGAVLGADISTPMLEVARARARAIGLSQASFVRADAQTHAFAPADGAFSRFGVMFFDDPPAAFANIRRALSPGGRLAFVCWRAMRENPWMTAPLDAAAHLLPPQAPPVPHAPGPFGLADRDHLRGVLAAAGFAEISIEPHDQKIGWADVETAVRAAMNVGPLGRAVGENPAAREPVEAAVRQTYATRAGAEGVRLDSATWIILAR
jgi:SAM-dependent methyltransferase